MTNNVTTCNNGHNFDANIYDVCPYCPRGYTVGSTKMSSQEENKTQIAPSGMTLDETVAINREEVGEQNRLKPGVTRIIVPGQEATDPERKLVGLLVSYDLNAKGKLFELYEGKNTIGSSADCNISITTDSAISGKHVTILFRGKKHKIKDEFSTNGTFLNNNMVEEDYLSDKDEIRIGNARFIFLEIPFSYKY